jgi:cbb3-type cytochrome oxidase subunit 1
MQPENVNRRLIKFIWAAMIFFAWALIQGAIIAGGPVRLFIQEGPGTIISAVHTHIGLMGWLSLALMATIYYQVPIFSGKSIAWPKLIGWIFWILVVCLAACGVLMIIAGVLGGHAFADGVKGEELKNIVLPYAMPAGILCMISAIAGLMFVVQIFVSLSRSSNASSKLRL